MRKRANSMARRRSISRLHSAKAVQLAPTQHTKSLVTDTTDYFSIDWANGAVIMLNTTL